MQLSRPSAVLDDAHLGDIEGALGRIKLSDEDQERRGLKRKLITFLAIVGPGLIVMVGDNNAGGVSTYAQAGQNYGYTLLWTLLLLIPVLIVNQEMVVRLGAVTGVGHARLINERFGRFWGWFSVGDLFILNFLTIVTEFIGVSLALRYFHVSPYISVPLAGVLLVAITASGSFARWERSLFAFIAVSLILFPLALTSDPDWGQIGYHFVVPGVQGGFTSTAVLLIIAIVGTTVAPWQLFFQQSNVIDKRITPRFIGYERADTTLGAFVVVIGATAILIAAVFAVRGTSLAGNFTNALGVAHALEMHGQWYGTAFAIVLLDASIIGASAVTLSTSYAFGDVFGIKHSLHRKFREAKPFYASYSAMIVAAAAIVLIPGDPARAAHRGGAGPGRDPAAQRGGVPAAPVQRPRGTRPVDEPALAERPGLLHHRRAARAVRHAGGLHAVQQPRRTEGRRLDRRRAGGASRPGRGVVLADQEPPAPAATAPADHDVRGRAGGLAHAADRAAQAGRVVHRTEGRPPDPARLPGGFGPAADLQGRPARRRLTRRTCPPRPPYSRNPDPPGSARLVA